MSDDIKKMFTAEELATQSKLNAYSFMVVSYAYVKKNGLSLEDFTKFIGDTFAPGWNGLKDKPVKDVARMLALNFVSIGGSLQTFSGDETKAEFTVGDLPNKEWMFFDLDLSQAEFDILFNVSFPIMKWLDLTYSWAREGDIIKITISR